MNQPMTFSAPASLRTSAQAFAVDPEEITSSMRMIFFQWREIPLFILKAFFLFARRELRESFDCRNRKEVLRAWSVGIPVARETCSERSHIWSNPRRIYRLQCIGTGTIIQSELSSTRISACSARAMRYRESGSIYSRSEWYLYLSSISLV